MSLGAVVMVALLATSMASVLDLSSLSTRDRGMLLKQLYLNAVPVGDSSDQAKLFSFPRNFWENMARDTKPSDGDVLNRKVRADLTGQYFDTEQYNRFNGQGKAEEVFYLTFPHLRPQPARAGTPTLASLPTLTMEDEGVRGRRPAGLVRAPGTKTGIVSMGQTATGMTRLDSDSVFDTDEVVPPSRFSRLRPMDPIMEKKRRTKKSATTSAGPPPRALPGIQHAPRGLAPLGPEFQLGGKRF